MANLLEDLCDSSPAKRARLEFGPFHLASDEEFGLGNGSLGTTSVQRGPMGHPSTNNDGGQMMLVPSGMAGSVADDLLVRIDPGLQQQQTSFCNSTTPSSTTTSAFTGGVSSSSDNVNEFDSGGDSGFNELLVPSSSDNGTDHAAESSNDVKNFDLLCGTEPDSSMTSCIIDSFNDVPLDIDDKDDVASTISHLSGLSDLSDVSGQDWKPIAGPISWVQRQMQTGANPREVLQELVPIGTHIPDHLDDMMLWKIVVSMLSEPPCRKKLSQVNTLQDVVQLLRTSKRIIVLTGAGVSVSCGIPDFRSRDGVYARLAKDFPDLPDPQAMFDIHYFRKDPRPFFKFAREIYPGQFKPSPSHRFIKLLEAHNKLLRNYSQNIDTLEQIAGIESVIQCHGSFATATCTRCGHKVDASAIKDDVFQQKIPACPVCVSDSEELAVMKPDIVFFGEGLPEEFHSTMAKDKDECDLLIVIGSSLKVRPVALIPNSIPGNIPQVLINREPLRHLNFDVELLGDCDVIINELCLRLGEGWNDICFTDNLREIAELPPHQLLEDQRAAASSSSLPCRSPQPSHSNTPDVAVESASRGMSAIQCRDTDPCDSTSESKLSELSSLDMSLPSTTAEPPQVPLLDSTNKSDGADPTSENDIEALRACWKPKLKENLADRLPAGTYLFVPSNRYIFSGAEVLCDTELDSLPGDRSAMDSDSDSDETTSTSSGDTEPDSGANAEADDGQTGSGDDSGVGDMRDTLFSATDITTGGDTVSEMTHLNWSSTAES